MKRTVNLIQGIMCAVIFSVTMANISFAASFTDNGDTTITDGDTGLVWQKSVDVTTRSWTDGLAYCETLSLGSKADWRMPNVRELQSIVDITRNGPAINTTYFPNTQPTGFWSSTTYAGDVNKAWILEFSAGLPSGTFPKTSTFYIRCVRGGR